MTILCKRCGIEVPTFSPMRKWCVECRRIIGLEQAKIRKLAKRNYSIILKK